MDAIRVEGLSKRYGKIEALGGVDLRVSEGMVFGLVGPNGAGKTTLIKALVGALRPTGGEVRVLSLDPLEERAELRQRIGYMPQFSALYEDLSAQDNVEFFGAAHRTLDLKKRSAEVLEFTDLTTRAKDPIYKLSGGMKRRVSLACTLVSSTGRGYCSWTSLRPPWIRNSGTGSGRPFGNSPRTGRRSSSART